jgi:multicomponent Na+:H+ antiporter subunit E
MNPRHLFTPVALAMLWWLLTDGSPAAWVVGVPAVVGATWAAWSLGAGGLGTLSLRGLLLFMPLFLVESLRGGVDVARRTLTPRMRLKPGFVRYRTGLQRPAARMFFANCVCLLPGTLASDLEGDRIELHLLDSALDPEPEMQRLEKAVARLYRDDGGDLGGVLI